MTEPAQRTPEWFEQRKGRVTGSMVGAILGLNPWMTRADAMRAMVREALGAEREFKGNAATKYGSYHEAGAIFDFEMETGIKVKPAPFVTYEDWLGASPDGYTSDGGLIEVKCPYSLRDKDVPEFKPIDDQPHYMAQMQVQMYVTGTKHCWFYQWAPRGFDKVIIDRDEWWLNDHLPRLRQFHAEFLDELANSPDEHLAPKRIEIDTPEAARMVAEWDELNEQLERAAERKKDLLEAMVRLAGEKNALIGGRKLTLTERKGSISYAKAIKSLLPDADLTPWQGKPTTFWGLR